MPEMTETQTPGRKPKKKKNKESHNAVERHRKEKINAGINRIGNLLPCSQALKQSKNMILDQAFRYITDLKKQNDTMLLEGGDRVQAEEIRRLRRQMEDMRKESGHYIELLKAHDINFLEDPTIHWKGKQRCAKVAKVMPTHQLPKGIIVYSNGNVLCPAGKEVNAGKQPSEAVIVQPSPEVGAGVRVNGALLQVNTSSPAPSLLPGAAIAATESVPGLRVVEQCLLETPTAASTLPPSVSYITLQIPAVSTGLPQLPQPTIPAQSLTVAAGQQLAQPIHSLTALPEAVVTSRVLAPEVGSVVTQDTAYRTVSYTTIPDSSALLRAGAAGSTQTTWTTLQLTGNTVQPVCQSTTSQTVQQLTVCPTGNKPSIQPIQIQVRPQLPVQQAPITAHIQAQPIQRPPQLRPGIPTPAQQPILAPHPQCAVLPQSAIVVSQPQPAVLQPASVIAHPPTGLIPQPQPLTQTLVPQPQATVLPLLQTMQVLQVNPTGTTVSGVTASQSTHNPSVVFLQQANACPNQSIVREELTSQTPCQHIVIIQAPNQNAPAPQTPQVGMVSATVPTAVPAMPTQITTTSCATSTTCIQTVGGKQLVHILPRPIQPQVSQTVQVTHTSSSTPPAVATAPQTITVNGQVFALQPMKTFDKAGSQGGTSTLQLVQPTTTEEPTTNVALNSLGALSSLNQSISQGLPLTISGQNSAYSGPLPVAAPPPSVAQQQQAPPPSVTVPGETLALPLRQLQVPAKSPVKPVPVVNPTKVSRRKPRSASTTKKTLAKRTKAVRRKELKPAQPAVTIAAKPAATPGDGQTVQVTRAEVVLSSVVKAVDSTSPVSISTSKATNSSKLSTQSKNTEIAVTSTQSTQKIITISSSSIGRPTVSSESLVQNTVSTSSTPQVSQSASVISVSTAQSEMNVSHTDSSMVSVIPTVNVTAVKPMVSNVVSATNSTVTKPTISHNRCPEATATTSTAQTGLAATPASTTSSTQNRSSVTDVCASTTTVTTVAIQPSVRTVSVSKSAPVVSTQATQPASVCQSTTVHNTQDPQPCSKPQPPPTAPINVSTTVTPSSAALTFLTASAPAPVTSEFRKRVSVGSRTSTQQQPEPSISTPSRPAEVKLPLSSGREMESQKETLGTATTAADIHSGKDFALAQQVYTNLDHGTMEHSLTSGRQTDSPMTAGAGGGRGFSVASMLPQGHSISSSSGSFGSFTFTSEQAEILAMAMLEQESPGRRGGSCSADNAANPSTAEWEPPKTPPTSNSKDRGLTGHHAKLTKTMDAKPLSQVSISGPTAIRHPQNISYSQAQSHPPVQSQSQSQTGTVASLSVNNLIRPSSNQHPYPGSPSMSGQQGSVPSPVGTSPHIIQPSNNALPPCSGAVQLNDYTPLKSALMRAQASVGVGERHVKTVSKRQAQEDAMLPTGKRPKACLPPSSNVGRMDVKPPDHSQMMVGQLPSSAIMPRINPEGPLFSTNSFMSTVLRPAEGHCPPQGLPEQNQPGVLHLPQGHSHHGPPQPGQHLGGNPYMKQQQQEQQRHHLYQLQHHLTQPDPAQLHTLHQRALQQQDQQHVQKKRGLVRGNQTGSPAAGLQQKQHHLEKPGVQQQQQQQQQSQQQQQQQSQHPHQQQATQHQQHTQSQQHQQQQSHQQSHQAQHQQSHQQQHQPPQQQHQQQHQQQQQQLQQQQQQQQSSHSRHQQHLQQQIQQQQQHFGPRHQEKSCEAQGSGPRAHHSGHLAQQDHLKTGQDHNAMQRLMSSRNLEQQLIPVSRPSELICPPSRQERHRVSNYSAEALIGKSPSSGEQQQQQQRMGLHLQPGRSAAQEQADLRGYLDTSRGKANIGHNPQNRLPQDHPGPVDIQRVSECPPFKTMGTGTGHQLGGFEAQVSRGGDMAPKSVPPSQRGQQQQQQGGFRMGVGPPGDGRARGSYSGPHPGSQGVQIGVALPREQDGCHQSFMQSLLSPHLPEQSNHQRTVQCCPPVSMEYSCVPCSSSVDMQAKASSPSVSQAQKAPAMRLGDGNKGHIPQVSGNMHGGPAVRAGLPHPPTPHSSAEPGRSSVQSRPHTSVSQRSRHIAQDNQTTKLRPGDRPRSGTLRPNNPFEPDGHLTIPSGGGVLLGRPQSVGETRRSSIVRFMADSAQVTTDNNLVPDQHLAQNFGFPFIGDGGMNPPPINTNSAPFIPPVSQSSSNRTPALLPVEPQNTLPSFYPSYSPAAHPSLPSDIPLQYFSNQMFTSPSADKGSAPPLNNRFGSILSPPRPVGFGQASFPLLPDMPPMPITNSSGITPHLSNFSLTSLFPEIATAMPTDGSAMPMSPLLSLSNTSSADSSKQPNRPAHNISHILGHDGSSAV